MQIFFKEPTSDKCVAQTWFAGKFLYAFHIDCNHQDGRLKSLTFDAGSCEFSIILLCTLDRYCISADVRPRVLVKFINSIGQPCLVEMGKEGMDIHTDFQIAKCPVSDLIKH